MGRLQLSGHKRQVYLEDGAAARAATHLDPAFVPLYYTTADGKTQTRSLSHPLGGEEGVEYLGHVLRGDAAAVVRDRYKVPRPLEPRCEIGRASCRERV